MEWVSLEVSEGEMLGIFSHLCLAKKTIGEQPLAGWADLLLSPQPVDPPYLSGLVKGQLQGIVCGECAEQCCSSPCHTFCTYRENTSNTSITCTQEVLKAKITKLPKETRGCCQGTAQQAVLSWQRGALGTALEALHSGSSWKFNANSNREPSTS